MLEPLVEGGGCIAGLALLYYFEVWRPAHRVVPPDRRAAEADPAPAGESPEP